MVLFAIDRLHIQLITTKTRHFLLNQTFLILLMKINLIKGLRAIDCDGVSYSESWTDQGPAQGLPGTVHSEGCFKRVFTWPECHAVWETKKHARYYHQFTIHWRHTKIFWTLPMGRGGREAWGVPRCCYCFIIWSVMKQYLITRSTQNGCTHLCWNDWVCESVNLCLLLLHPLMHSHTHTPTRTLPHSHSHTNACTHTHVHAVTHQHTRVHTHTHTQSYRPRLTTTSYSKTLEIHWNLKGEKSCYCVPQ